MPLPAGLRVGAYEIVRPIGAGGMGEVDLARDNRLNRDVALKVLPQEFTLNADRLARFTREAQLLASLNHPNIAAIYGLEESSGGSPSTSFQALVLEMVEGPTLAGRIAKGELDLQPPGLADHLWQTTMDKLAVDQPNYAAYRRELESKG